MESDFAVTIAIERVRALNTLTSGLPTAAASDLNQMCYGSFVETVGVDFGKRNNASTHVFALLDCKQL